LKRNENDHETFSFLWQTLFVFAYNHGAVVKEGLISKYDKQVSAISKHKNDYDTK
jgi:hypothetical protein